MLWRIEHLFHRPLLHHTTVSQDRQAVGCTFDHFHVMGDQNEGEPPAAAGCWRGA